MEAEFKSITYNLVRHVLHQGLHVLSIPPPVAKGEEYSMTDNDFRTLDMNDYNVKDRSDKGQGKSGFWGDVKCICLNACTQGLRIP